MRPTGIAVLTVLVSGACGGSHGASSGSGSNPICILTGGCAPSDDTGTCCAVGPNVDPSTIPSPSPAVVAQNLEFNCESATCVSFQSSKPYCSRSCTMDSDCASGFSCETLVHANAPPLSQDAGVPSRFCVKPSFQCTAAR
jgi:hypothetical protein